MKVIVFGLGDVYSKVKPYFYKGKAEIVALVDNSQALFGTLVDGHTVDSPQNIRHYQYDSIVITSLAALEMKRQLIGLGISPDKITHYLDFIGSIPIETPIHKTDVWPESVLIISNNFGYHGGPVTSVNLACILKQKGYKVTIAVPDAEQEFLEEISSREGIEVIVVEKIDYLSKENLEWTNEYTYIFANTIVMARCAIKLSRERRVYLWLHESVDIYSHYEYWYDEIADGIENENLMIGAVSEIARQNFLSIYHTEKKVELLPYGIDDRYEETGSFVENRLTTFTIIAPHIFLKGIDVLFNALHFIPQEIRKQCRFFFAGKSFDTEYGKIIRNHIDKNVNCEYFGELSRNRLFELYSKTDVVIIPSRCDSLPLVATEAMMMKKPCIISDTTGTAKYIKHKYNGLVFKNENREELAKTICWCLKNHSALKMVAENARKTYETWFTTEKFADRVMDVIKRLTLKGGYNHMQNSMFFKNSVVDDEFLLDANTKERRKFSENDIIFKEKQKNSERTQTIGEKIYTYLINN